MNMFHLQTARDLLREIAEATWVCGDPGMQYDTLINRWHTCPNSGRINASNPCSEYMHVDDSACNLASLNLMKFVDADGVFLVDDFRQAVWDANLLPTPHPLAAIPAVLAFNRFSYDIERVANRMETFIEEFSNVLQRSVGAAPPTTRPAGTSPLTKR